LQNTTSNASISATRKSVSAKKIKNIQTKPVTGNTKKGPMGTPNNMVHKAAGKILLDDTRPALNVGRVAATTTANSGNHFIQ
jgi:hypothetical protein